MPDPVQYPKTLFEIHYRNEVRTSQNPSNKPLKEQLTSDGIQDYNEIRFQWSLYVQLFGNSHWDHSYNDAKLLSAHLVILMSGVMGQQEPQEKDGNTTLVWMELNAYGEAMLKTTWFQRTKNNSVLKLH